MLLVHRQGHCSALTKPLPCMLLQLATGDYENKWGPVKACLSIDGDDAQFARTVQIAAGLQHTLALIAHKGKVKPFAAGVSGVHLCTFSTIMTQLPCTAEQTNC